MYQRILLSLLILVLACADFSDSARITGSGSAQYTAVANAWKAVNVD